MSTGLAARDRAPAPSSQTSTPAATASRQAPRPAPVAPVASHAVPTALSAREQSDLVKTYCATCHSERAKAGGLSLAGFDAMKAHEQQDVVEKMIRKLSAGLMPPPGAKKPEAAQLQALTTSLEARMDEYAASNPNPGRRTFQRLNRPEYERAIARPAGARRERRQLAAARPEERQLRQHRRRAGRCRRRCSRPTSTPPATSAGWRWATGRRPASTRSTPTRATSRSIRGITSRARPTGRAAGWWSTTSSRPTASTCSSCWSSRATTPAARTSTSRSTASASRC